MAEDRFSRQASAYSLFRPSYPPTLYQFIQQHLPSNEVCWDCGTGTGQVATELAKVFKRVIATDLSSQQIFYAKKFENIDYQVCSAETFETQDSSLDLITVAQALHWLDLEVFFSKARRFLKPKGMFAVWGYDFFSINEALDDVFNPYGRQFLGPYWSSKNQILFEGYKTIQFPFSKIEAPNFTLSVNWDLDQLVGYLDSWSATQQYKDLNKTDPFEAIAEKIFDLWGPSSHKRTIKWDLYSYFGSN